MEPVWVGCSGWSYHDWREAFYPQELPQSRWLEYYASVFDTVEVNATFYRLPTVNAVASWVSRTPDGFRFAVKGSRYLTHIRRLRDLGQGVERFWQPLEPLRESGKLGPVLWQLPPDFPCDPVRLQATLRALPPALHCFEFRHPSWFTEEVRELLASRGAGFVIAHDARRELPQAGPAAGIAYVRLHYGERGRRGNYSGAELARWGRRIAAWRARSEVFAYFNNDWSAYAPRNALTLRGRLTR
jgi:uncharacterized protein YecE (DUF72 family)